MLNRISPSLRRIGGNLVATHEAGHAVAAVVLRLSLQYVTLRPRGGENGATYTRKARNETTNYLQRCAVCDFAGIAAERLLNGNVTPGSGAGDFPHAHEMANRLGVADVEAFFDAKTRAAQEIVALNREAIEAVKRALVEKRTLSGSEVRRIMRQGNPGGGNLG